MGHILSNSPNEKWQLDIFYLIKYHKQNHGYKYILACVDIFTRKAYAIPLKLKDDENVSDGIKEIIKQAQTTPYFITSDSDSTFLSNESDKIFHKYDIIHKTVPVGDHAALGIIDIFSGLSASFGLISLIALCGELLYCSIIFERLSTQLVELYLTNLLCKIVFNVLANA